MLTLRDHMLLESLREREGFSYQAAVKNIAKLNRVCDLSRYIRVVTLNSRLDNVIDLHYLLNQVHTLETESIP